MVGHLVALVRVQPTLLHQDRRVDAHLADLVELRRVAYFVAELSRHADMAGQQVGILVDPLDVVRGCRDVDFRGSREQVNREFERVLGFELKLGDAFTLAGELLVGAPERQVLVADPLQHVGSFDRVADQMRDHANQLDLLEVEGNRVWRARRAAVDQLHHPDHPARQVLEREAHHGVAGIADRQVEFGIEAVA
jgi:hypothetical protein